jgi:DNA-directed RNA polymerase subunit E'/Rpb7
MPSLYKMDYPPEVKEVLEELCSMVHQSGAGVTLSGNRLTVRFNLDNQLVDVHMIIENVTTPTEQKDWQRQEEELKAFIKKYTYYMPGFDAEISQVISPR